MAIAPVKAVWITARHLRNPREIPQIVETCRNLGIQEVFLQVGVGGYAYYRSDLLPLSEYVRQHEGYDPLAEFLKLAHAAGIRVHAWINTYLYWTLDNPPQDSTHLIYAHPEWFLVDDEGRSTAEYTGEDVRRRGVDGRFLEPRNPEVNAFLTRVYREVAERYPVDGVHFDFVRYPGPAFGFAPEYREAYRKQYGLDPMLIAPQARIASPHWDLAQSRDLLFRWNKFHYLRWNETRIAGVMDLVRRVRAALDSLDRKVELSAAVFPNPGSAGQHLGQDWRRWAEFLDILCPMNYTPDVDLFRRRAEAIRENVSGTPVYMGVGVWFPYAFFYVPSEFRIVRELGFEGLLIFDYKNLRRNRLVTAWVRRWHP